VSIIANELHVIGAQGVQSGDLTELRTSFVALSGRSRVFFASMMNREEPALSGESRPGSGKAGVAETPLAG
jgi:hypothetical protein